MKKLLRKKMLGGVVFCATVVFIACSVVLAADPTAQNPRVLSFSMMNPPSHFMLNDKGSIVKWIEAVEKETGGRIKFKIYNAESLGKGKDQINLVLKGIADCSGYVQAYTPGYFPLTTIAELPFAAPGKPSYVQAKAMWDLYKQGLLDKKYNEFKVINIDPSANNQAFMTKKVMKLEDFKGLKISASGPVWIKAIKALGGSPIQLSVTDSYLGLQRGMIDVRIQSWAAAPSYKLYEVVRYALELQMSPSPVGIAMNLNVWNSLPPDIQTIIDKINERFVGYIAYGTSDSSVTGFEIYGEQIAKPLFKKKGVEVYQLPPQEMKKMHELLVPLWDEWVNDMESKGLNGKKVMKAYLAALKKYGADPPYDPTWK